MKGVMGKISSEKIIHLDEQQSTSVSDDGCVGVTLLLVLSHQSIIEIHVVSHQIVVWSTRNNTLLKSYHAIQWPLFPVMTTTDMGQEVQSILVASRSVSYHLIHVNRYSGSLSRHIKAHYCLCQRHFRVRQ